MFGISEEALKKLKEQYPSDARVELISMTDEYQKLEPGEKGTIIGVDDIGTIHVDWDCGSSLGIIYNEDSCRKIEE